MKTKKLKSSELDSPKNRKAAKNTTDCLQGIQQVVSSPAFEKIRRRNLANEKRSSGALRRMEISPEDLAALPVISDTLQRAFSPNRPNEFPRKEVINFIACSPDADAQAFLETYRELPKLDRDRVPIEAICLKAQVNPLKLLGVIVASANAMKKQESALKTILAHPEIVDATVNAAKNTLFGAQDRRMIHTAVGWLPTKQGSSIAVNIDNRAASKGEDSDDADEASFDEAFPLISEKLSEWSENRRLLAERTK